MMKLFRFCKWVWVDADSDTKIFLAFIAGSVIEWIMLFLLGISWAASTLIVILTIIVTFLMIEFIGNLRKSWIRYKKEKETEATQIVNRLTGKEWN